MATRGPVRSDRDADSGVGGGPRTLSPRRLKVGDRIRFVSLPEEWNEPGYTIHKSSAEFMKRMIRRGRPCRIAKIEHGSPWIRARLRAKNGRVEHHFWAVTEK